MKFLFELTEDYLIGYQGKEVFRATVYYEVRQQIGITDHNVVFPFECISYLTNTVKLASDIWDATLKHAEALLQEDKEFEEPKTLPQEKKEIV